MKRKLLFLAALVVSALGMRAQSWTPPTITSEDPVSGTNYKVYNVGSGKYLQEGKAWFSWSTTAILSDNGRDFTFTGNASSFTFTNKDRSGNNKVFTSGNGITGDAMHVDGADATNYGLTKLPNGYYHIHDAGGDASSACWGYNSSFHATGVVAHADATATGWNCEWAFLTDASFTLFDARVKLYNELLKAYTDGVNTDAAGSVYNNTSSTLDAVNGAYNTLHQDRYNHALATASETNPIEITEWVLKNADFSAGNINEWQTNYVSGQQAQNIGYQGASYSNGSVTISQFIEAWKPGAALGDGYLRQTVSNLPEGKYVLEADGISVWQNNENQPVTGSQLYITADGVDYYTNMSTKNNKPEHFSVQFLNTGEGDVIFGLRTVSSNGNWLCADNFKVTFYGIDLSAYVTQLANEVATFNGYENSIDATAFATLKAMVDEQNKTYTSSKTYAAAIANVQAINAYAAALVAANAVDQNAKMNAGVLSALQTEIGKATSVTLAGIANALSDLTTATTNATASIANYVEAKAILDAANGYDEAGQASYNNNVTVQGIKILYKNGSLDYVTDEQKAATKAALATACKAQTQPADGCDMTAFIVNPGIDGNANGWTTDINGNGGYAGGPMKPSNDAMEFWGAGTLTDTDKGKSFDYYQELTGLPDGAYTIGADLLNSTNGEEGANWNGGGNAGVYGKTASAEVIKVVTEDGETFKPYTTDEILVVDGTLRLGVKNIHSLTGRWFACDNFKLTYARQLTAEEVEAIAKANAIEAYNAALAAATAIAAGTIPTAAYTTLSGVIAANNLTDGTSTEYNTAATALNNATAAAQPLVAPYAEWKALKPQADALLAVSTNDTDENTALASAISTQNSFVEGTSPIADSDIVSATSTLKAAMVTYATTAEPTNDECFDLTFMIVNPHFTEGAGGIAVPTGWTLEDGAITEHRLQTHNFEAYHTPFNLSQTIAGLQKGTYKVTLQGFARHDNNGPTDKTNLYCGIVNQPIKDIKDEYSTTNLADGETALGDNNGATSYTIGEETRWQPNGMSGSYYFFQETNPLTGQPFYTNEVQTLITTASDLTIGFKCETNTDWVIWDNFHLYYYGSAIDVTIDEGAASSIYTEDIENANVTLKRTFKANTWNTFFLPFNLTDAETKAAFGTDVQVAVFSEDSADPANATVNFDKASDAAITANVPVLLKTNTTETSFKFDGKTIKAGEAKATGTNFDLVGTYAATTTIADGDYFISNDMLYKSSGATTIKGTRAYIKNKNGGAIKSLNIFDEDGNATAIDATEIEGLTVDGKIFDLSGREVKTPVRGLYIQNGKKVFIK